jgi:hypothetical protein
MEVIVSETIPDEYKNKQPLKTYETRYIYTGFRRYDVETKQLSCLELRDGRIFYTQQPCSEPVLSRAYSTELVRVILYSESPRIWAEELSPHEVHFFQQQTVMAR